MAAAIISPMALFRYPGSKVWWYDFRFASQRIRESTKTRSRQVALHAQHARRRQLEESYNSIKRRQGPRVLSAAAEDFLAAKRHGLSPNSYRILENDLRDHVLPVLGNKILTDISCSDIAAYQERRLREGAAPRTVNMEIGSLRGVLRRNRAWEDLRQDIRMLRVNTDVGICLTEESEARLLEEAAQNRSRSLYPALVLALSTGMRHSELRLLRWRQLDFEALVLTVGQSKTQYGTGRKIPLNERAAGIMKAWSTKFPGRQPDHYVFPYERYGSFDHLFRKNKAYGTDPTRPIGSWKTAWRTVRKQAQAWCRFHDLRHTACTRMLVAGTPFAVVAALMGWSAATSALMIKKYGHIGQKSFQDAVAALNGPNTPTRKRRQSHSIRAVGSFQLHA